ncbi:MAG TPA: GNAT family N-acetyltransferase [Caulobacteraceae bacterium]|nr:GNAT family N-acetyltransferase [Caulobacteraceae bacterium]
MEPIAARAWRAAEASQVGGWRLYASAGFSGRINACWPLQAPDRPLNQAIAETEAWYAARRLKPIFKIVEAAAQPAGLIQRLESLGYSAHTPTLMMIGPTTGAPDPDVLMQDTVDEAFEAVFAAAGGGDPGDARERLDALARIVPPRAFARIDVDGAAAAIGACAVEGEWTGVFGMRTDPRHRRKGLARRVFASLMAMSRQAGARRAYLQVEAVNAPAIALYEEAGFAEAYRYHYWSRP